MQNLINDLQPHQMQECDNLQVQKPHLSTYTFLTQWNHSRGSFNLQGVLLSSDLSWSHHIKGTCSKAKNIMGLLYRHYCQYSSCRSLPQLCLSLVRPYLDYAAQVWDPHPHMYRDINSLECTKLRIKDVLEEMEHSLPCMSSLKCSRYHPYSARKPTSLLETLPPFQDISQLVLFPC